MLDNILCLNYQSLYSDSSSRIYAVAEGPGTRGTSGDFTPSKACTPMCIQPGTLRLPFESIDIHEISKRICFYIDVNRQNIVNYVDFGKQKSVYLMEEGTLYKNHIILHNNMNSMTFVHIEVFLSKTSQEYLVEINRVQGSNNLFKYFIRGLKRTILTGETEKKTITEQEYEDMVRMGIAQRVPSYVSGTSFQNFGIDIGLDIDNL